MNAFVVDFSLVVFRTLAIPMHALKHTWNTTSESITTLQEQQQKQRKDSLVWVFLVLIW